MPVAIDGMMAALRGLGSSADTKDHYDRWAPNYDTDLVDVYGYIGPSVIANAIGKDQISKSCSVLDAGCSTGLIGEELKKRGFLNLYGADISTEMRSAAEKKAIYSRLIAADFSKKTTILDGVYDIVVAADVFGPGQFSADALAELIRLVRRGGYIYALVEVGFFEAVNFPAAIADLERREKWVVDRILSANIMKNAVRPAKLIVAKRV